MTIEAQAACAAIVDDPAYRRKLIQRARTGRLSPAIEALLWHYAKGKPKDEVSMDIVATTATLNTADVEGVSTERLEEVQAFLRQLLGRGD